MNNNTRVQGKAHMVIMRPISQIAHTLYQSIDQRLGQSFIKSLNTYNDRAFHLTEHYHKEWWINYHVSHIILSDFLAVVLWCSRSKPRDIITQISSIWYEMEVKEGNSFPVDFTVRSFFPVKKHTSVSCSFSQRYGQTKWNESDTVGDGLRTLRLESFGSQVTETIPVEDPPVERDDRQTSAKITTC